MFDEPTDPRPALELHRDNVTARLQQHRRTKRLWEKYRWVAEYHNAVVEARLPGEAQLLVSNRDTTWRFTSFA